MLFLICLIIFGVAVFTIPGFRNRKILSQAVGTWFIVGVFAWLVTKIIF